MCRAAETTRAQAKELCRDETSVYEIKREEHHTHNALQNKNKQKRQIKTLHVENVDLSTSPKNNNFSKCCKAEATKKKGSHNQGD